MKKILLVGNPNTGKSTIFNALTGKHQHTGNWSGKTVGNASGIMKYKGREFEIIDLPGIYSVNPMSEDERQAVDCLKSGIANLIVVVLDATCLERNLILASEISKMCTNVIVCVNLIDEAEKKGITIDIDKLSEMLKTKVIPAKARKGIGIDELKEAIYSSNTKCSRCCCSADCIYKNCVYSNSSVTENRDRKIDKILTSRVFGIPIMLFMLCCILWITIWGANYPSGLLSSFFSRIEKLLLYYFADSPIFVKGLLIEGVFRTLSWVVAVMLPPMAIFFPLFTILEDLGYLPRIAFNLDHIFKKVNAHSKMILSMCMGLGCNAAGVISTRIIESRKERLIAVITNNFMPCNGRFSSLIMLAAVFISGGMFASIKVALAVTAAILSGVLITFIVSYVLSNTILKGEQSSFILELPPYRMPQPIAIIRRSIRERIVYVLFRAVVVAAPAGALIWLLQNVTVNDITLLSYIAGFLDPFAQLMGMDGYLLTAFIIGLPANEIVIPIVLMCYTGNSSLIEFNSLSELGILLRAHNWTYITAICAMIFSLNHFPCATTLLTIKKETGSLKWTVVSFLVPTVVGIMLCMLANAFFHIII